MAVSDKQFTRINPSTFRCAYPERHAKHAYTVGNIQEGTFRPHIDIDLWEGECGISLDFPIPVDLVEPDLSTDNKRLEVTNSAIGITFRFYNDTKIVHYTPPDGYPGPVGGWDIEFPSFEYEVQLDRLPPSNQLTFGLGNRNLRFFKQPMVAGEGQSLPDEVKGSYAVYHATKKGFDRSSGKNYRQGKAFHIFRPRAIDALGVEAWGELSYNAGTGNLVVSIPQDFLDNATYPVRFASGLELGNTATPGSSQYCGQNDMGVLEDAGSTTAAGDGNDITFYDAYSAQAPCKGVLQAPGGTSIVTNGITPAGVGLNETAGWVELAYSTAPTIADITGYWPCVVFNADCYFGSDDGPNNSGYIDANNYASPVFSGQGNDRYDFGVYLTYGESSGETYIRNILSSINLTDSNKKLMTFKRPILEAVDLSELLKRLIDRKRLFQENVDLKDSNKKAIAFKRIIQSTISLFDSLKRLVSTKLTEIIMETIDLIESVKYPFVFKRPVYALVNLNGSNKRSIDFKRLLFSTVDFVSSNKRAFSFTRSLYGQESINDSNKRIKGLKKFIYDAIDIIASVKDQLVAGGEAFIKIFLESVDLIASLKDKTSTSIKEIILEAVNISDSLKSTISTVIKKMIFDSIALIESSFRKITFLKLLYGLLGIDGSLKRIIAFKRIVLSVVSFVSLPFRKITYKRMLLSVIDLKESLFAKKTILRIIQESLSIVDSILGTVAAIPAAVVFYKIYKFLYNTVFHSFKVDRTIRQFEKPDDISKMKRG